MTNGEPEWYLDAELTLFTEWSKGAGSQVTNTIEEITQKTATSFDEFAQHYAQTRALDFFNNLERLATGFTFLEGPVYDAANQRLLFCDAQGDAIHQLNSDDQISVFRPNAGMPSGLVFDSQHRLLACENKERRVTRTELDGTITTLAERFLGKRINSPNDIITRSDDTIYFTDPPYGLPEMSQGKELDFNGVYKISPQGELSLQTKDLVLPNGLVFSLDEKLLYINDSSSRRIHCFDVSPDGTLTNNRVFAKMTGTSDDWSADGMTIDNEGNIYSIGPKGAWIFTPNGELIDRIYAPEVLTNLTWGKDKTLYLTGMTSLYRTKA